MPSKLVDESLLQRACAHAVEYLREIPERAVAPLLTREDLVARLQVPLSDAGEDAAKVIDVLAAAGAGGTTATAGPRFFGFVIGGTIPAALAADWLTSAWDQNAGVYVASPIASVAEDVAAAWLLDILRLPAESGVGFVTGGQMANFTSLAAARHAVLRRAGWDVEQDGLQGAPHVHVVATEEVHVTVQTAARMLGLGVRGFRPVETDEQGRMRPASLREVLASVEGPTIVCSQAGNVNTGAVDPVDEIVAIAHERGAWVHVDGAFGLWGRASDSKRGLLRGVELADSWGTDAHKWLNVPYDSGIAIVRDRAVHRAAMTVSADYLEQGRERDGLDWTPEFSRRARAIPIYAALRTLGRSGVAALVDRCCDLAERMASILSADPRVEILNDVVLNQVLVRFSDSDEATRETIRRVQEDGTCWLSGTRWHGVAAMRISVSNWATSIEDAERSAAAILRSVPERK